MPCEKCAFVWRITTEIILKVTSISQTGNLTPLKTATIKFNNWLLSSLKFNISLLHYLYVIITFISKLLILFVEWCIFKLVCDTSEVIVCSFMSPHAYAHMTDGFQNRTSKVNNLVCGKMCRRKWTSNFTMVYQFGSEMK